MVIMYTICNGNYNELEINLFLVSSDTLMEICSCVNDIIYQIRNSILIESLMYIYI